MKLKKCFTVIMLMLLIPLASCASVGNEITGEVDKVIQCRITASDANVKDVLDTVVFSGYEAEYLLEYFTYAEYYEIVDSVGYPRSFTVSFYILGENGEYVPMYDREGILNEYFVQDTDTVYSNSLNLGNLPGVYEKLLGYIIDKGSSGGYFCKISTDYAPSSFVRVAANEGREMYKLLTESGYVTDIDRTDNEKVCIIISYSGASFKTFYVYEDDFVYEYDYDATGEIFTPIGMADGLYGKAKNLLESSLYTSRDKDVEAGVRLTQIDVRTKPGNYYSVHDFFDVGCIYLIKEDNEEDYYSLFFNDINKYYYDVIIETLKARDDIAEVIIKYVDE